MMMMMMLMFAAAVALIFVGSGVRQLAAGWPFKMFTHHWMEPKTQDNKHGTNIARSFWEVIS